MADEEEPINPRPSRERRRRHLHTTSDDNKNAASNSNIAMAASSKEPLNSFGSKENGAASADRDSSIQKKRHLKKHAPEPEVSEEAKESSTASRSERRRQKKPQNAQRIPRSVSEEVLALEGKFQPQYEQEASVSAAQPSKRSRRARRRDLEHDDDASEEQQTSIPENQMMERQQPRPRPRSTQPKKKRKTRARMLVSGDEENYQGDMDGEVSEIFKIDKEDIIQSDVSQSTGKIVPISAATLPSQPLDFLFVEKRDGQGFIKEHKSKSDEPLADQNDLTEDVLQQNEKEITSVEFALQVHNAFRSFTLICHGLLSGPTCHWLTKLALEAIVSLVNACLHGIALIQCVFVYSLSASSHRNLLENYYTLAQPFQSLYYFLLAICTLSVVDRYVNIGVGWSQFFLSLLSRPSRALAIVGYLFALVFSVSLAQLDDKISLYKDVSQLWTSTTQISTWRVINLLRVIGAILGWIAVSMNPMDDQASRNLSAIIEMEKSESKHNVRAKSGTLASWEHQGVA